ncbi:regulator of Vps4 activity in the MVB pathway protein [Striga asiatica]|uniref:Regulator of Vps4 activity in the MVB pathway protein n=1 Tax=Striga asiatica TaxID=4170 RepID=A0A5A7PX01_STRAF|nr:regulator of Vps4 activity in the MVB pathway protein [Striga asiatica]
MLDGILGRGFSVKCKSLIKTTRARIEVVRKRADAKQRFLREDLAKLLSNGLDINAYGRTEEFVAGMNILFCYDFVEQCCEYTAKQLSKMQKQGYLPLTYVKVAYFISRMSAACVCESLCLEMIHFLLRECPEECRVPVACLMYAAARFSDLPELRELRDIFEQRYGNCLEAFVNQKFVEKLSSRPSTSEKRLKVLQDIASEFSIKWDYRGFERRMTAPSAVAQVHLQKVDVVKQSPGLLEERKGRIREGGADNNNSRRDEAYGVTEYKEKSALRRDNRTDLKQSYLIEKSDSKQKVEKSNEKVELAPNPSKGESKQTVFREKVELAPNRLERTENDIPSSALPPPYVKSNDKNIPPPPYMKAKEDKYGHGKKEQNNGRLKELEAIPPLPRPRSTRKKHHKLPNDSTDEEHEGRRREHSRKGLQILFDEDHHHKKDEEERMIDKLLMHYSKKPSSYEDAGNLRKKSPRKKQNPDLGESSVAAYPTRSVSLPHEQHHQITSPLPEKKVFTRANTFEQDRNQARHVHPKLPDYDDLAARFAALKGG